MCSVFLFPTHTSLFSHPLVRQCSIFLSLSRANPYWVNFYVWYWVRSRFEYVGCVLMVIPIVNIDLPRTISKGRFRHVGSTPVSIRNVNTIAHWRETMWIGSLLASSSSYLKCRSISQTLYYRPISMSASGPAYGLDLNPLGVIWSLHFAHLAWVIPIPNR